MKATYNNVPEKYLKIDKYFYYHVFTDNEDAYFNILKLGEDLARKQAFDLKDEWVKDGCERVRVYIVEEEEDYRDGAIDKIREDCIFSLGDYPY